jgi:hypothetical protein
MGDSENYSRPLNSSSGEVDGSRYLTRRCARCETEVRGFMQAGPGLRNPADWPTRCRFPRVSGLGCDVLSPVLANHKKRYILLPSSARGHNPLKLEGLLQAILASRRFKPRPVVEVVQLFGRDPGESLGFGDLPLYQS